MKIIPNWPRICAALALVGGIILWDGIGKDAWEAAVAERQKKQEAERKRNKQAVAERKLVRMEEAAAKRGSETFMIRLSPREQYRIDNAEAHEKWRRKQERKKAQVEIKKMCDADLACVLRRDGGGDKIKTCRIIVRHLDRGSYSARENNYFMDRCVEVGPRIFIVRFAQGIFNLREANR